MQIASGILARPPFILAQSKSEAAPDPELSLPIGPHHGGTLRAESNDANRSGGG